MTVQALTSCKLYVAQYELSGHVNSMNLTAEVEPVEKTTFGSSGMREYLPGLLTALADFVALFEADGTGKPDDVLHAKLGAEEHLVTMCPTTGAAGEPGYFFKAIETRLGRSGNVGNVFLLNVGAVGTGTLVRGTVLIPASSALTATGNSSPRELGAVAAGQSMWAALHVIAVSGTSPTLDLVLQSDDAEAFSSPANRIAFSRVTAPTSERLSVAGPITDTWWRAAYTIAGTGPSFTLVLVVGVR